MYHNLLHFYLFQVGFYSDDEGLNIDRHILESFTEPPSTVLTTMHTPKADFKFKLKPDNVLLSPNPTSENASEETPFAKSTKVTDFTAWKILEDTSAAEVSTEQIESEQNVSIVGLFILNIIKE